MTFAVNVLYFFMSLLFKVDLDDDLSSKSIFFAWPEMCEGPMERI